MLISFACDPTVRVNETNPGNPSIFNNLDEEINKLKDMDCVENYLENNVSAAEIVFLDYTVFQDTVLNLSEEHLRETLIIGESPMRRAAFVATSSIEKGIIHIFIDQDSKSPVVIENHLQKKLGLKEVQGNYTRRSQNHVFIRSAVDVTVLQEQSVLSYQPKKFKNFFPKPGNPIELCVQLCLYSIKNIELSKPIMLKEDIQNQKLFIPNLGVVFITACFRNAQLKIVLHETEMETKTKEKIFSLPDLKFSINSLNVVLFDYHYSDNAIPLMSLTIKQFLLNLHNDHHKPSFEILVDNAHIDNQLNDVLYHFPVLLLPLRQVKDRYKIVSEDLPFLDYNNHPDEGVLTIKFDLLKDRNALAYVDMLSIKIAPCEVYIEDSFLYRLAAIMDSYKPYVNSRNAVSSDIEKVTSSAKNILHPLPINNIHVGELSLLLTFHASIKLFLAADHIPLTLGIFQCKPTLTVAKELVRTVLYHYVTQALVRTGWILGSLELIGNPTSLIHNIGRGLSDFFVLPYQGLIRGPSTFVSGISYGVLSLLKHTSKGALTSINNVSSSISRNMDRLCLDDLHSLIQEERRASGSTRVTSGLSISFGNCCQMILVITR